MTIKEYWNIVNNIQTAKTAEEMRKKCNNAEKLIRDDSSINNDDFDELMMTIAYLHRESYRLLP
jgi:hypothetical protein